MAANETGTLSFFYDLIADRGNRVNAEVYRSIPLAQIGSNESKLIGQLSFIQLTEDQSKETSRHEKS